MSALKMRLLFRECMNGCQGEQGRELSEFISRIMAQVVFVNNCES
jgi:hypothetical protein